MEKGGLGSPAPRTGLGRAPFGPARVPGRPGHSLWPEGQDLLVGERSFRGGKRLSSESKAPGVSRARVDLPVTRASSQQWAPVTPKACDCTTEAAAVSLALAPHRRAQSWLYIPRRGRTPPTPAATLPPGPRHLSHNTYAQFKAVLSPSRCSV